MNVKHGCIIQPCDAKGRVIIGTPEEIAGRPLGTMLATYTKAMANAYATYHAACRAANPVGNANAHATYLQACDTAYAVFCCTDAKFHRNL